MNMIVCYFEVIKRNCQALTVPPYNYCYQNDAMLIEICEIVFCKLCFVNYVL